MKKFSKRVMALGLMASFGIVSCEAPPSEEGSVDPSTTTESSVTGDGNGLKIASLAPITGDLSSLGQNFPVAVRLAVDTVNGCGGVNDAPVTLLSEDTQTDPNTGSAAMTKLAEIDKVAGVVGAFASSVSTAALDVAVRNKVMMISPGSTSPKFTETAITGAFDGYWARTAPSDAYQAPALAKLAQQKGFTRVSTVAINNDYGVAFEQEFIKAFEALGGEVINKDNPVRYDPKATTLDTEASLAFKDKPDAVVAIAYGETGSILLQSAYQQGLSEGVTIMLPDGMYADDIAEQVGKSADGKWVISGAIGTVPGADGNGLTSFDTIWKQQIGSLRTAYTAHAWDAANLLMLAAEAADVNTGDGIKSKLKEVANGPGTEVGDVCEALALIRQGEDINYQGASGNVDIDDNGDVIGSYDVWTVNDEGKVEIIDNVKAQ